MRLPPFNPYIAVVIGVIALSTPAILVKLSHNTPASILANYRLFFAALLMAPYVLIRYRKQFYILKIKDWLLMIIASIFLALHFILWFESLNYTSVASSVVLISLQPILMFIGSYLFFKERFSVGVIISIIISFFGSAIISWGDFSISNLKLFGNLLAIGGAIAMTVYFLCGQRIRRSLSLLTYTFIVYLISSMFLGVYNMLMNHSFTQYEPRQWTIFIALAILPTFFGHTLYNWSLKWLSNSRISMAIVFQPICATLLAYLILGEIVTYTQWLGGTVFIFGLFLFVMSTSRKREVTISTQKK